MGASGCLMEACVYIRMHTDDALYIIYANVYYIYVYMYICIHPVAFRGSIVLIAYRSQDFEAMRLTERAPLDFGDLYFGNSFEEN